jgi:hypothetical protein
MLDREKLSHRIITLVILGILSTCLFYFVSYLFLDHVLYTIWVSLISPKPRIINSEDPIFVLDLPNDVWPIHEIEWNDNDSELLVYYSEEYSSEVSHMFHIDYDHGEITDISKVIKSDPFIEIDEDTYFESRNFYTICPNGNYGIHGYIREDKKWKIEVLYNNEPLFDKVIIAKHWSEDTMDPRVYPVFSPGCDLALIVFHGWAGYEYDGRGEIYLLDIKSETIEHVLDGRKDYAQGWDDPVQSIGPSWSPTGDEFVFGDRSFGLEIFNLEEEDRRWLLGPYTVGYVPTWSNTGNWIVTYFQNKIIAVTPDGKYKTEHKIGGFQNDITDISWSVENEKIAIRCFDYGTKVRSLWIWDLPSVPE